MRVWHRIKQFAYVEYVDRPGQWTWTYSENEREMLHQIDVNILRGLVPFLTIFCKMNFLQSYSTRTFFINESHLYIVYSSQLSTITMLLIICHNSVKPAPSFFKAVYYNI